MLRTCSDFKFSVGDSLELSRESISDRRSGRDTDKTVLSCLAWRCELAISRFDTVCELGRRTEDTHCRAVYAQTAVLQLVVQPVVRQMEVMEFQPIGATSERHTTHVWQRGIKLRNFFHQTVHSVAETRYSTWASAHRGKWGQLTPPPGKMDEKLKRENMQKSSFLNGWWGWG